MKDYSAPVSEDELSLTVGSCKNNGLQVQVVDTGQQAKELTLSIIPKRAEVFTMTSVTLEETGIAEAINKSGEYSSVRESLNQMDPTTQKKEMRRLSATPDWVISSAHAVTQEGHLLIASNTGSQLAAEAYGAEKVLFVVGTQKIVRDDEEGLNRIHTYVFPLEDSRALQAYGVGSFVSKLLTINREVVPGRVTVLFVKEKLGF
jgi:hypothetical protein